VRHGQVPPACGGCSCASLSGVCSAERCVQLHSAKQGGGCRCAVLSGVCSWHLMSWSPSSDCLSRGGEDTLQRASGHPRNQGLPVHVVHMGTQQGARAWQNCLVDAELSCGSVEAEVDPICAKVCCEEHGFCACGASPELEGAGVRSTVLCCVNLCSLLCLRSLCPCQVVSCQVVCCAVCIEGQEGRVRCTLGCHGCVLHQKGRNVPRKAGQKAEFVRGRAAGWGDAPAAAFVREMSSCSWDGEWILQGSAAFSLLSTPVRLALYILSSWFSLCKEAHCGHLTDMRRKKFRLCHPLRK